MTDQPAGTWREENPLELSEILQAALHEFYAKGYHGTPVREIARQVGVTVPALYYHHENKEAILLELLDASTRDYAARAQQAEAEADDDVVTRLRNVVESIALGETWRPELSAIQSEMRYLSPENHAKQAATRDEVEAILLGILQDGVEAGVFRVDDVALTVRAMLGMLHWIPVWFQHGGALGSQDVAQRYADLACRMVGLP